MPQKTVVGGEDVLNKESSEKVYGPTFIGRSTSLTTVLRDRLNALTTNVLGFISKPSIVSFVREFLGSIINEDHVSTRTLDIMVSTHSIEI